MANRRTFRLPHLVLALGLGLAVAPACGHAGVLLWQVTGMEGAGDRFTAASRMRKASAQTVRKAEPVWPMPGFYRTAQAVMRWDIWQYLKAWMVATGRAPDESSAVPAYRDLTDSGYISISAIEMPEMTGNRQR